MSRKKVIRIALIVLIVITVVAVVVIVQLSPDYGTGIRDMLATRRP